MSKLDRALTAFIAVVAGFLGALLLRVAVPATTSPYSFTTPSPSGEAIAPKRAASANPTTRLIGAEFVPIASDPFASGKIGIYEDAGTSTLRIRNADNSATELSPGWAQNFPNSGFGVPTLRQQAAIGGYNQWLEIDPHDGQNPPWSCSIASSSNGITDAQPDFQVGCGHNQNPGRGTDTTRGHQGWNMESHCARGTGCPDWTKQMEWYFVSGPQSTGFSAPSWQALHTYYSGDFITNTGGIWLCVHDGMSAGAGSGPVVTDSNSFDVLDGSTHWRLFGGKRWLTANQRVTDGVLSVGMVADSVGIGNGNSINSAGEIVVSSGNVLLQGSDGLNSIRVPTGVDSYGVVNPISFVTPGFSGTPVVEMCPPTGCTDGSIGLALRVGINSNNGGGTLNIGTPSVPFKDVNVTKAVVRSAGNATDGVPPVSACTSEGLFATYISDSTTHSSTTYRCRSGPITGSSGLGATWQTLPGWELYGEDRALIAGSGTFDLGHEVQSSYQYSAGGVYQMIHLYAVVTDFSQSKTIGVEVVASEYNTGNPLTGVSTLYRTVPYNTGLGTKWTLTMVANASTGGVKPQLIVEDGETYMVKWTMTGVGITN